MNHIETILFLPTLISINKITKHPNYGRLFFHSLLTFFSIYEIYNNKLYFLNELNTLYEYNYYGNKCNIIALQYFLYDLKYIYKKKQYLLHHIIFINAILYSFYFNKYSKITIYMGLHEISSIFLDLKLLNIYPEISSKCFYSTFLFIRISSLPIITYYIFYIDYFIFTIFCINCFLHICWLYTSLTLKKNTKIHILNKNY